MRSPADMRNIQIDITNACVHTCSNCTRFCGHHKSLFFMDYEFFKKAVDSLDGFPGCIGLIGGEPTLHPDFEKMARYLGKKYKQYEGCDRELLKPQDDLISAVFEIENRYCDDSDTTRPIHSAKGPGLWSTMGKSYKKNYEVIQDVFKKQLLNDHENISFHQPLLLSRKELGIPDEEWIEIRDNCWIQNEWSATITPKGAFFCEVAAALDMLYDGPGGWDLEPNWWKRKPTEFGEQLNWCEICAGACGKFARNANEEIDDISPLHAQKLKGIGSPKYNKGKVNVWKIKNNIIEPVENMESELYEQSTRYLSDEQDRLVSTKSVLYENNFEIIKPNEIWNTIGKSIDNYYIVVQNADEKILCDANNIVERLKTCILNPGSLIDGLTYLILNGCASSLKKMERLQIEKWRSLDDVRKVWDQNKIILVDDNLIYSPLIFGIEEDKKYAIFGTGDRFLYCIEKIKEKKGRIALVVDNNKEKVGIKVDEYIIESPDELLKKSKEYDYVLISSDRYRNEIYEQLRKMDIRKIHYI